MTDLTWWWQAASVLLLLGVAAAFKPWAVLKHQPLQSPWLAAMVVLPWVWSLQHMLPSAVSAFRVGGACLLVLMFGWPLAIWSVPLLALGSVLLAQFGPNFAAAPPPAELSVLFQRWVDMAPVMLWSGMVPATMALLIGLLMRRFLPAHLFVYILGRAFFGTALAITATGVLGWIAQRVPPTMNTEEWLLGHWLLGWGEAISTGMLTAIFVAFKPHWLLTYSDARYLPGPKGRPPKG